MCLAGFSFLEKAAPVFMKEDNIWLTSTELQQMLRGSLLWPDVAPRTSTSRVGMRNKQREEIPQDSPAPDSPTPDSPTRKSPPSKSPAPRFQAASSPNPSSPGPNLSSPNSPGLDSLASEAVVLQEPFAGLTAANSGYLEGQPVVWLLGGVALITLSSWFYFVMFAK